MTLEELIAEGNTFEIKRTEPKMYFQNGLNVIEKPVTYIENGDKYLLWIENCKRFLVSNYKEDIAFEHFEEATKKTPESNGDIYKLVAILKSLISLPAICAKVKDEKAKDEHIVVNVNQSQNINIDIVLQAIKDEIGRTGIQSLKDIEGETEKEKKQNILSKLKEFGESTLSNIVANILTNPTIWTQL